MNEDCLISGFLGECKDDKLLAEKISSAVSDCKPWSPDEILRVIKAHRESVAGGES